MHGLCVHNYFTAQGFFYLISFGDQISEVAGSLTVRQVSSGLLLFNCSTQKRRIATPSHSCCAQLAREGVLHIYKPLGNLTDISGTPQPTPDHLGTKDTRGSKKLVVKIIGKLTILQLPKRQSLMSGRENCHISTRVANRFHIMCQFVTATWFMTWICDGHQSSKFRL